MERGQKKVRNTETVLVLESKMLVSVIDKTLAGFEVDRKLRL